RYRTNSEAGCEETPSPNIREPRTPRGRHSVDDDCPIDDLHPQNQRLGIRRHIDLWD
ncbi:hypothetical protein SARC_11176, partial [Sphaeroforma arctica JP610]